jgi:hypothetical protein
MGVDSGLPDFRGTHGFWRAYSPLQKLGISFEEMAQPHWFTERPLTTLVRINPDATDADERAIPIRLGAPEAIGRIAVALPARIDRGKS